MKRLKRSLISTLMILIFLCSLSAAAEGGSELLPTVATTAGDLERTLSNPWRLDSSYDTNNRKFIVISGPHNVPKDGKNYAKSITINSDCQLTNVNYKDDKPISCSLGVVFAPEIVFNEDAYVGSKVFRPVTSSEVATGTTKGTITGKNYPLITYNIILFMTDAQIAAASKARTGSYEITINGAKHTVTNSGGTDLTVFPVWKDEATDINMTNAGGAHLAYLDIGTSYPSNTSATLPTVNIYPSNGNGGYKDTYSFIGPGTGTTEYPYSVDIKKNGTVTTTTAGGRTTLTINTVVGDHYSELYELCISGAGVTGAENAPAGEYSSWITFELISTQ